MRAKVMTGQVGGRGRARTARTRTARARTARGGAARGSRAARAPCREGGQGRAPERRATHMHMHMRMRMHMHMHMHMQVRMHMHMRMHVRGRGRAPERREPERRAPERRVPRPCRATEPRRQRARAAVRKQKGTPGRGPRRWVGRINVAACALGARQHGMSAGAHPIPREESGASGKRVR